MKEAVVIKSYANGINMILNDEMPFDDIIQEIEYKFKESKSFFGKANVALSFEGRLLNYTEELSILDTIRSEERRVGKECRL